MSWRNKVARQKRIPEGWDLLEPTLEEFEQTMREAGQSPPHTHTPPPTATTPPHPASPIALTWRRSGRSARRKAEV